MSASEQHIVYAVVDRGPLAEQIKVRVSEPLAWDKAMDRWHEFDELRLFGAERDFCLTAAHMPVNFFAVRSADDPTWPSENPRSILRIEQFGLELS